jgi:hypothetical protein
MQLYADCGQSAAVVAGGSDRRAVYAMGGATQRTGTGDPSKLKIVIMRHWLDLELVKKNTPSTRDAHDRIQAAIDDAEALEAELPALRAKIRSASAGPDKELARAEFDEKVDDIAEAYWAYYRSLSSTEKVAVDQSLKINASAVPKVGQGYTISTGGATPLCSRTTRRATRPSRMRSGPSRRTARWIRPRASTRNIWLPANTGSRRRR